MFFRLFDFLDVLQKTYFNKCLIVNYFYDKRNLQKNMLKYNFIVVSLAIILNIGLGGCNCPRNTYVGKVEIIKNSDTAIVKVNDSIEISLKYDEQGVVSVIDSNGLGIEIKATISRSKNHDIVTISRKE